MLLQLRPDITEPLEPFCDGQRLYVFRSDLRCWGNQKRSAHAASIAVATLAFLIGYRHIFVVAARE